MYVCVCICMYVCAYVCTYVRTYVHMYVSVMVSLAHEVCVYVTCGHLRPQVYSMCAEEYRPHYCSHSAGPGPFSSVSE